MITSFLYGVCFLVLASIKDAGARLVAGMCLLYLAAENVLLLFSSSANNFDITLYLTAAWALDSILLFCVSVATRGVRQILVLSLALPLMLLQVFVIQYPDLFSVWIYSFAVHDAHRYFIESFIFVYSWRENTVSEWFRTGTVMALVVAAHLV